MRPLPAAPGKGSFRWRCLDVADALESGRLDRSSHGKGDSANILGGRLVFAGRVAIAVAEKVDGLVEANAFERSKRPVIFGQIFNFDQLFFPLYSCEVLDSTGISISTSVPFPSILSIRIFPPC